jgi:hypothetical protein
MMYRFIYLNEILSMTLYKKDTWNGHISLYVNNSHMIIHTETIKGWKITIISHIIMVVQWLTYQKQN